MCVSNLYIHIYIYIYMTYIDMSYHVKLCVPRLSGKLPFSWWPALSAYCCWSEDFVGMAPARRYLRQLQSRLWPMPQASNVFFFLSLQWIWGSAIATHRYSDSKACLLGLAHFPLLFFQLLYLSSKISKPRWPAIRPRNPRARARIPRGYMHHAVVVLLAISMVAA